MGDRTMPPPRGPVNPRKKFAVKPGFSMLDWNLLKTRASNLAGRDETGMLGITKAEVRKHNSQHDCWSIFRGKVYNLTPFLHYHPGGVPEIMKGAGRDCTALFDKYHPWVNFDSLVGNLYIGPLITEKKLVKAQQASSAEAEKAKKVDESKNVEEAERTDASEKDKEEAEGDGKASDKEGIAVAMEGIALAGRAELDRADSAGAV